MISCIVLPVSWLPDIAEKTACDQLKGYIHRYVLSTSSLLCDIGEPAKQYRVSDFKIGYQFIFNYLDNLIPCIVLPKSRLPNVTQKTTCTQNVAMDVTFHLRYVPAFNNIYILSNP